jgi:acyl carrier protein
MSERERRGQAGLSVRWPAVSGVGMAAATILGGGHGDSSWEKWSIGPASVYDVLVDAFSSRSTQAARTVLPVGLSSFIAPLRLASQFERLELLVPPVKDEHQSRSLPHGEILSEVRRIVMMLTDDPKLTDDSQLMDCGIDSIGATELSSLLSERFCTSLPSTLLFSYPSIRDIGHHISGVLNAGYEEAKTFEGNIRISNT